MQTEEVDEFKVFPYWRVILPEPPDRTSTGRHFGIYSSVSDALNADSHP